MKRTLCYIVLCFFAFGNALRAQNEGKTKRIEIVYGGEFTIDNVKFPGATIFKSDGQRVQFRHQGLEIWCDLAVLYEERNEVIAHGDVQLQQGDTLQMSSQYILRLKNCSLTAILRRLITTILER